MRPTLAIVPLALLLSWLGPAPTEERSHHSPVGDMRAHTPQIQTEVGVIDHLAFAWESLQSGARLQAKSELPQRR